MADICRTLEQPAETQTNPPGAGGRRVERIKPTFLVRIDGKDLEEEFLADKITDIQVEETARGLSKAVVKIQNDRLGFTDHELLEGRSLSVEIFTGYVNTRLVKRGKFFAAVPKYAFRNRAMPIVKLECYGEEWPLTVSEQRAVHENLRDSDIARRIASAYGLLVDIDPTEPVHEHVAQFNVTDMEFLENRALLHGFDVYVKDGTLHFHAPRFEHSGLSLLYGQGEAGLLTRFEVCVDPWVKGASWTKSGMDRLTGKEYEFRSNDEPGSLSREIQTRAAGSFQTAAALAEVGGVRPRRYIVGDGHEQTEGEARNQVRGFNQATEWIVTGSGSVRGIEFLHARSVVSMLGLGHLSGDYYVSRVCHRIGGEAPYTMDFEVMRPGTGALAATHSSRAKATPIDAPSAGTAEVRA